MLQVMNHGSLPVLRFLDWSFLYHWNRDYAAPNQSLAIARLELQMG